MGKNAVNHRAVHIYTVGGAVRDRLLGRPIADRDWVVVGATPQYMLEQGFRPVGKDFPVFLHPQTHEEYALARTERKTAPGYHGFTFHAAPDVTLEQDLIRRDLTINAMAEDQHGQLIDPHHGQEDLRAGILRHVSPAFGEDPVRILRVARFAARFGFSVAPETLQLMRDMVAAGEVDALVAERVWQEMSRALMEDTPSGFLRTLRDCGALARILPEVERQFGAMAAPATGTQNEMPHCAAALDTAARQGLSLPVRFALMLLAPDQSAVAIEALCTRLRVPTACRELALLALRWQHEVHKALELGAEPIAMLLQQADAFRRPDRFTLLLQVCSADAFASGVPSPSPEHYPPVERLQQSLAAAQAVDVGAIAMATEQKAQIPERIHAARVAAISQVLHDRTA